MLMTQFMFYDLRMEITVSCGGDVSLKMFSDYTVIK
jgi:hypothetical protein